jgi:hypothetical protein
MNPPRVFVSYSHDSAPHKQWVLAFTTTLRQRGVDAVLDQWELSPGDDLPHFMETQLAQSDFALMICTETYVEKANAGKGGVGYEKMILTGSLLQQIDESKVIPIIRQNGTKFLPTFHGTKVYVDFSKDDEAEYAFDELLRKLLNAPLYEKPELGTNPFRPMGESRPDRTSEGVRQIMSDIAASFEGVASRHVDYARVLERTELSRLTFDLYANEAIEQGLIARMQGHFSRVIVTPKGLQYLADRQIIKT